MVSGSSMPLPLEPKTLAPPEKSLRSWSSLRSVLVQPDLQETKNQLVVSNAKMAAQLKDIESTILKLVRRRVHPN